MPASDPTMVINRTIIGRARIACLCLTVTIARENTLHIYNTRNMSIKTVRLVKMEPRLVLPCVTFIFVCTLWNKYVLCGSRRQAYCAQLMWLRKRTYFTQNAWNQAACTDKFLPFPKRQQFGSELPIARLKNGRMCLLRGRWSRCGQLPRGARRQPSWRESCLSQRGSLYTAVLVSSWLIVMDVWGWISPSERRGKLLDRMLTGSRDSGGGS